MPQSNFSGALDLASRCEGLVFSYVNYHSISLCTCQSLHSNPNNLLCTDYYNNFHSICLCSLLFKHENLNYNGLFKHKGPFLFLDDIPLLALFPRTLSKVYDSVLVFHVIHSYNNRTALTSTSSLR